MHTHRNWQQRRRLVEETELWKSLKKACKSLWTDVETTRQTTVNLRDRREASRVAFNEELCRVDKLAANLAKRDHAHASELAAKAKELEECEATRSLELELLKRLEANCNDEIATEEQLGEVEAKLLEVEEKNRQLAEQTNNALTDTVNRCLRGIVIWHIETQMWQQLWDLERRVTAMIACSIILAVFDEDHQRDGERVCISDCKSEGARGATLGEGHGVQSSLVEPSQGEELSCRGRTENRRSLARGCDDEDKEHGTLEKDRSTH
ncbi:hypothetical protein AXG93_1976s1580 [Marchantia polymorpha subsp. ruderalis]|uniref:Uncharacterized protein n=1 Tax=Marchantia polymorpha subsp. ruderalis TaxID=1480154 RepID=A0A176VF61_MARPO|nr:hypothetical protein AXG93_1976s1580 [Marchantia polymorpha subsp. ruderalis]